MQLLRKYFSRLSCTHAKDQGVASLHRELSFATEPIHAFKLTLRHSHVLNTNIEADELFQCVLSSEELMAKMSGSSFYS